MMMTSIKHNINNSSLIVEMLSKQVKTCISITNTTRKTVFPLNTFQRGCRVRMKYYCPTPCGILWG